MKSKWMLAVLVVALGAGVYGGAVLATPAGGLTTSTLAKATVGDLNLNGHALMTTTTPDGRQRVSGLWIASLRTLGLSDVYVIDNKIAPGGTTGWHSHPGPSLVFVVAGTVTNYSSDEKNCAPQTYTAGQSFTDPGGDDSHVLHNEGTTVAETIAVQFLPTTATRRIDEPAPSGCPAS
jgi:quercetin dioxygenase-like cupin family protein